MKSRPRLHATIGMLCAALGAGAQSDTAVTGRLLPAALSPCVQFREQIGVFGRDGDGGDGDVEPDEPPSREQSPLTQYGAAGPGAIAGLAVESVAFGAVYGASWALWPWLALHGDIEALSDFDEAVVAGVYVGARATPLKIRARPWIGPRPGRWRGMGAR